MFHYSVSWAASPLLQTQLSTDGVHTLVSADCVGAVWTGKWREEGLGISNNSVLNPCEIKVAKGGNA